jgi:hypothetical protein
MSSERSRLILTLAVVVGLGALVFLFRRRRNRREQAELDESLSRTLGTDTGRDTTGIDAFVTLRTLEEARTMDHTAVVLQGGSGAQIYLTVPVKYVSCDGDSLVALLASLDAIEWNDPAQASLSFELAPIGSGIYGGMGGGSVIDGIWMHPRLSDSGILPLAADVIYGRRRVSDVRSGFPRSARG